MVAWNCKWSAAELDFALARPDFTGGSLLEALRHPAFLNYLSVIIPMGIFNVVGSLQNIESAEAAGDRYRAFPSLLANGIGSVVAALLGSVFATTIYIGHPGWKRLGARSGYSVLNGLFIALICLTGTIQAVLAFIPLEVRHRHSSLYRHHHRCPVFSGDAQRNMHRRWRLESCRHWRHGGC